MEIDIDQWILNAACERMRNQYLQETACIYRALIKMYPDADITQRVRQQVKEYKKLTMWE